MLLLLDPGEPSEAKVKVKETWSTLSIERQWPDLDYGLREQHPESSAGLLNVGSLVVWVRDDGASVLGRVDIVS